MRDLNKLIYTTIRVDPTYKTLTGATTSDPRIYKLRTPMKVLLNPDDVKAYSVYGMMRSSKAPSWIDGTQRNYYVYRLEVYAVTDTLLSELCDHLESLFEDIHFVTPNYLVGYTFATRSSVSFEEERRLYLEAMMLHLENIYAN